MIPIRQKIIFIIFPGIPNMSSYVAVNVDNKKEMPVITVSNVTLFPIKSLSASGAYETKIVNKNK